MVSKEKIYTDKRIALMRSCILLLEDIVLDSKKSQLKFIDLAFLKSTEQKFKDYHNLLNVTPKIPRKLGESTD